jgi:hypothetical protein
MYDHLKQSGNMFDIFKHAILMKAVELKKPNIYFESHCGLMSYDKPVLWESSWIKVQRKTGATCILCDINPEIGKSIPLNKSFYFMTTDGFEEAKIQAGHLVQGQIVPDLFFIDPPYVDVKDWSKVAELSGLLSRYNATWIVWYPIFRNGLCFKHNPSMEMYWKTDNNLQGCGMAFNGFNTEDITYISHCLPMLSFCLSSEYRIINKGGKLL